jgi:hypothetical protein
MMLDKELQQLARRFTRSYDAPVATIPDSDRRYRFRLARVETVVHRVIGYDRADDETYEHPAEVTADVQAGEILLPDSNGIEWRAGYYNERSPADLESRFFPWNAVLEVRGETAVVLEERDSDEEEVDRVEAGVATWADVDRYAEDWRPTRAGEDGSVDEVATLVLDVLRKATRVTTTEAADA